MRRLFLLLLVSAAAGNAADLTGHWVFHVKFFLGSGDPTFDFEQKGGKLTGTYHGRFGVARIEGTVQGDDVEFRAVNERGTGVYKGKILSEGKLAGTARYPAPVGTGKWTGVRQ